MKVQENVLPSIELLVLKRDGRKVSFEQDKIFSALRRANQELEHPVSEAGLKIVLEAVRIKPLLMKMLIKTRMCSIPNVT